MYVVHCMYINIHVYLTKLPTYMYLQMYIVWHRFLMVPAHRLSLTE